MGEKMRDAIPLRGTGGAKWDVGLGVRIDTPCKVHVIEIWVLRFEEKMIRPEIGLRFLLGWKDTNQSCFD